MAMIAAALPAGAVADKALAAKPVPPPAPTYVGSAACKSCHPKASESWPTSPHGKALEAPSLPAELRGCEACHGPASLHLSAGADRKPFVPRAEDAKASNTVCGSCHFQSESSKAPEQWRNITGGLFARSMHGRKGLACVTCHSGHPNGNDKQLVKPAPALCLDCHPQVMESSPGKTAAYTHSPVAKGQCLKCHDPHGTPSRDMVVPDVEKACLDCHPAADAQMQKAHVGYPVANAKCAQCHNPHSHDKGSGLINANRHLPFKQGKCELCHTKPGAGQPNGLIKPAKELCLSCHPASVLMRDGNNHHVPAEQGLCTTCHSPHASMQKGLLKNKAAYVCFSCHGKIEDASVADYRHPIFETNMDCGVCHKPHSSPEEHLLPLGENEMCGKCHKHSFSHPIGKKPDGTPVIDPTTGKAMVCSSCHDIHGSKFEALTKADKSRDLCVRCHGAVEHQG